MSNRCTIPSDLGEIPWLRDLKSHASWPVFIGITDRDIGPINEAIATMKENGVPDEKIESLVHKSLTVILGSRVIAALTDTDQSGAQQGMQALLLKEASKLRGDA